MVERLSIWAGARLWFVVWVKVGCWFVTVVWSTHLEFHMCRLVIRQISRNLQMPPQVALLSPLALSSRGGMQ